MYELQGSRVIFGEDAGTRYPDLDLGEPHAERWFRHALDEFDPDVVSVLDLGGLPSSLIDLAREAAKPVVMTVHDYLPLCPTVKLYDADGCNCLRERVGEQCARCCAHAPSDARLLVEKTLEFELLRTLRHVPGGVGAASLAGAARRRLRTGVRATEAESDDLAATADAFQRRRETNLERLNRVDVLVACSHRVADLYAAHGVDRALIRPVHGTVAHLDDIVPRRIASLSAPLHFATLNGFASAQKGAEVLVGALELLRERALRGEFRVSAFGHVNAHVSAEVGQLQGVEVRGSYLVDELGGLLADVDVGLLPSVYEEPYAYSGLEFLAKGIPLIANAVGGSVEYTRDGETGWLNRSNDADGLARTMAGAIDDPSQVIELNARIRAHRDRIIKPMTTHLDELEAIYRELVSAAAAQAGR
jgi:glycosyltransferase involved in cell wall biosynthesis